MLLDKSEECIGSVILLGYCLWQKLARLVGNRHNVQSGYVVPFEVVSMHVLFADPYAAVMNRSSSLAFRGRDLQGDRNLGNIVHWAFASMRKSHKEWTQTP
ncbi:TPA: hypothetical protein ACH3X1_002187 [Trebouxia sp. C0004]